MNITGDNSNIWFDLENGYVAHARGERVVRGFLVYTDTFDKWEPPHESETISQEQIRSIISEVKKMMNENTVQIFFDEC